MKRKALWLAIALAPLSIVASQMAVASPQDASDNDTIDCEMTFNLTGWSAIYETADGHGTVTCENGQSMDVDISAKGGGLSVGKYKLTDGHGKFSDVTSMDQIPGTYATASAHAGAVNSTRAAAMTKGDVSLALTGTGQGWTIGAGFSGFTIKRAGN